MRATLRWAHADLRAHRGEALFFVLATAGIVASLLLAAALFGYAANPWQRVFTQSEGAHIWLHTRAGADTGALTGLDGVRGMSGPHRTVRTTTEARGVPAELELRAAGTERPAVARPQLVTGRWLNGQDARESGDTAGGVVLERSLAEELWAEPGTLLAVPGTDGGHRTLRVVGVAETAEPGYRPGERPGVAWAPPAVLDRAAADRTGQAVGLRLADPADTDYLVQRAVTLLGADQVIQVTDWRQARGEGGGSDRTLGLLFAVFGLGALLAAGPAASGAIGVRIRGQLRDIAVLKAVGFTPGQVVRIFLVQHLGFALLGAALGTGLIAVLGGLLPGRIGDATAVWRELPGSTGMLAAVPAATVAFIAAATSLTAWGAGRVPPVPAGRAALPAGRPMTGLARRALGLRLPPALVLGWRGAFPCRARTVLGVARLALPLLMITVALSAWTTVERFRSSPAELGLPAALTAHPPHAAAAGRTADDAQARSLLAGHPDVLTVHPGAEVAALIPGQTGTITLRGLGGDYPFTVVDGRLPHGPDEAVAGQGLLDLLQVRVGDWVRMTVEGRPQILHIVGRSLEPDKNGRVLSTALATLRETDPRLDPGFYQLVLRPGADPDAVRADLAAAADGRLDIRAVPNPADGLSAASAVLTGMVAVLALIGLTELLTAIAAGVRDRRRDLLALKAIGLTPRQIGAVMVTATGFTALAAAVAGTALGIPAGHWLIDAQGRSSGIGAGIAQTPAPPLLAAVVVLAVAGAVAVSAVPATRAARRRLADSLSETL
ncbi:ABC transporter permease [Streptomyces aidingensis]|uniref:Putative ABC transport system permease protein n=1 Tax=Streptomyces aidingensis TaxID=910347 RepID=A0A1I1JI22_9ACTN|nr:FtsX-like permease family protein [Streptomyces aidingensis]SFC48177.1 putative ABC transport system permease protein [Streptomyces aidingensis]